MDTNTRLNRLEFLRNKHKEIHKYIDALEGEKAPDSIISHQKKLKLSVKDEITAIENTLKAEGIDYVN